MRIALAQLNPTIGDVAGNTRLVLEALEQARRDGADVVVCPEMTILGYPPRDLLFRAGVVEACEDAVRAVAAHTAGLTLIVGHPRRVEGGVRPLRNSVSVCRDGAVLAAYDKQLLPGYDIFDEDRYFEPGDRSCVVDVGGRRLGVVICEDLWRARDVAVERSYAAQPVQELVDAGCDVIVSPNASPFVIGKAERHRRQLGELARGHGVTIVVVNQVGGNDDLVFDGRSVVTGPDGEPRAALPAFEPCVRTVDLAATADRPPSSPLDPMHEVFSALVLGLRDYCRKTGHRDVLLGLSGGIDSALTAVIAAAALGPAHVRGVLMPSRYSSQGARDDAEQLVGNLGLGEGAMVSIDAAHRAVATSLESSGQGTLEGLADENVQARLRGLVLMALSNASGALVLATGNKSELAVGYSTLYGDMCGAVSVIGDLLKTRVYEMARWINAHPRAAGFPAPPIPAASIEKPPSAELRPDQTDQDTLPPYEVLDQIIEGFVEREWSAQRLVEVTGIDEPTVRRWTTVIDRAQYKRDQAALILKVSPRTFGRGRPMPMAMRWTEPAASEAPSGDVRKAAAP